MVQVVQAGRSSLSFVIPSWPNNFCIGCHMIVKDRKGQSDRLFDEHTSQDTLGRPISKGSVDLSAVLDLAFPFVGVTFRDYTFLDGERQSSAQSHHHHFGINILFHGSDRLSTESLDLRDPSDTELLVLRLLEEVIPTYIPKPN